MHVFYCNEVTSLTGKDHDRVHRDDVTTSLHQQESIAFASIRGAVLKADDCIKLSASKETAGSKLVLRTFVCSSLNFLAVYSRVL